MLTRRAGTWVSNARVLMEGIMGKLGLSIAAVAVALFAMATSASAGSPILGNATAKTLSHAQAAQVTGKGLRSAYYAYYGMYYLAKAQNYAAYANYLNVKNYDYSAGQYWLSARSYANTAASNFYSAYYYRYYS